MNAEYPEPTGAPVIPAQPVQQTAPGDARISSDINVAGNAIAVSDDIAASNASNASDASVPNVPGAAPTDPVKHRLNSSYIWLGAIRVLPYILIAILVSAGDSLYELITDSRLAGYGLIVGIIIVVTLIVAMGIAMLARFISYKYIWYEYTNDEFSFFSGIISKKRVHIPYTRIQSVNQRASLLQRIVGVCTVSIETAGGAENKAVMLPYIERSAAEALRKELFTRKQLAQLGQNGDRSQTVRDTLGTGQNPEAPNTNLNALEAPAQIANDFRGVFGGDAIDTGQVTYEYGLSNKELVLSAITGRTSFGIILASIIAGLTTLISCASFLFGTTEDQIYDAAFSLISYIPTSWLVGAVTSLVGLFIAIMVVAWLITVASTCLSYGGFRARRRGARIETEYGIINHNFNGIDIDRIQSVEISQSFFQRLLKSCTISLARVASAVQDSSPESKNVSHAKLVVHPFVKVDRVNDILANLLPEWENLPASTQKLPTRATRRAIVRRAILQGGGFWLAIITFITMSILALPLQFDLLDPSEVTSFMGVYVVLEIAARILYALCLLLIILDIIGAILWRRGSGFGYDQSFVTITNSGFSTDRTIMPRGKLQMAELRTNPLQRHKRLITIIAITAAGVGNSATRLIDVEEADAQAWFAWCHPGGNKTAAPSDNPLQ
ncbi:PH domain-containing protein [Anaerotardibacter muris]|uniref:PH domain-containing protein n=1 Tax=Anaerotardibacter muris TaxID=2941505 RepID=UPI00203E537B|nr:PH domain-containing protein [Anaerotardibacter muris]